MKSAIAACFMKSRRKSVVASDMCVVGKVEIRALPVMLWNALADFGKSKLILRRIRLGLSQVKERIAGILVWISQKPTGFAPILSRSTENTNGLLETRFGLWKSRFVFHQGQAGFLKSQ